MENTEYTRLDDSNINLREQITLYLRYWPWFVISVIVLVVIAFLYLRYATPIYETKAVILIKDEKNSALSELAAFEDLGLTGSLSPSGFENEIQILKSKSLTESVVKKLNLNIRYYSEGKVRDMELYDNIPFEVSILTPEDSLVFPAPPFYIKVLNDNSFQYRLSDSEEIREIPFGEPFYVPMGEVVVQKREVENWSEDKESNEIRVNISSMHTTIAAYRQSIQVEQLMKMSSVIQLTLNASNTQKARAVLNELITQYNLDATEDRNEVARNTANFINSRLVIISEELDSVELGKVEFKQSNKLTDLQVEGEIFLRNESEFTKKAMEIEVQLELVRNMIDYVQQLEMGELLPANIGIESDRISSNIQAYNQVAMERSRMLISSTELNPIVVTLTQELEGLRRAVLEGLNNAQNSLLIQREDIQRQEAEIDSKITSAPSKEKIFRSISRQQEIKETLYLYLLQKREENAISLAVTTPKAKVVDYAYSSYLPVSPKRSIILLASVIVGLLIPFIIIYVRNLLDNKIRETSDITQVVKNIPVIGEIPKLEKSESEIIQANDRSVLAESFRMLRTNLQFMFVNSKASTGGKVIFVTSTIKGEGKTFCSFNLALTLANTGAKVVLVGADIRNPQIHRYSHDERNHHKGVVEFLVHEETNVSQYVQQSELNKNLSLIYSGTIPPNPAELWMRDRSAQLFNQLRQEFDYIVVDTAPTLLVTDTFLINKYADVLLYVLRAGYTEKRLLEFPTSNIESGKLKNVAFILNNVMIDQIGYGNRYGYYYQDSKNSFWKRLRKSF